jgi:hypothetical protein
MPFLSDTAYIFSNWKICQAAPISLALPRPSRSRTPEAETFELEGRAIPVVIRQALLKNKRAKGRDQDIADVKALERTGGP